MYLLEKPLFDTLKFVQVENTSCKKANIFTSPNYRDMSHMQYFHILIALLNFLSKGSHFQLSLCSMKPSLNVSLVSLY